MISLLQRARSAMESLAVLALASLPALAQTPTCQPSWQSTFGGAAGLDDQVWCTAVFDDGSGPALYVGGFFTAAGGLEAAHVAKWDGKHWSPLGTGARNAVFALAVFDDGAGPALYAGGWFDSAGGVPASRIAKWDGTQWSQVGSGLNGSVTSLAVFDDGSGPALYAGGEFTTAGAVAVDHIARWDGSSWSGLGSGVDGGVRALAVFDDGTGPALHAAGTFTNAGGAAVHFIAKWNGTAWSALGTGLGNYAFSLTTFDDGSGPVLVAGGNFITAGGVSANRVARWDGSGWSALGIGFNSYVRGLAEFDDGTGPALYACGDFTAPVSGYVAKWDGFGWSPLGSGLGNDLDVVPYAYALAVYDDGTGPALYTGGGFSRAGGRLAERMARWDGANWSALGNGLESGVWATAKFDDGTGPALYVGGTFRSAGGIEANRIARWDGNSWSNLGSGLSSPAGYGVSVSSLEVFDDGSGPALYVGGGFSYAGSTFASSIAKWDGHSWHPVGGGVSTAPGSVPLVWSLEVFDDGSGPALYVGGTFTSAGGVAAPYLARWNGSTWSAVGGGLDGSVGTLAVLDLGSGPALYVCGGFTHAGGAPASGIAQWSAAGWSAVGLGNYSNVRAITAFDDGAGATLYAAGEFPDASGALRPGVARLNGSTWVLQGSGVLNSSFSNAYVDALAVYDDGSGAALYAGGAFASTDGVLADNIAKWDGTNWSNLGGGTSGEVCTLAACDDRDGPSLLVGGNFAASPGGDSFLAKWGNAPGCGAPGVPICEPGAGGVIVCPCGNPPAGLGLGCNNSSNTGGAQLEATGIARITYDTVFLASSGERPTATSVVLQGTSSGASGSVFGQGVRCIAGNLKRLYVKTASGGSIHAPQAGDPHVHARSAALGDTIAPGTHRYYGVYYRDPNVLGACASTATYNITQQLDVLWSP
jgi:hypothetical protein